MCRYECVDIAGVLPPPRRGSATCESGYTGGFSTVPVVYNAPCGALDGGRGSMMERVWDQRVRLVEEPDCIQSEGCTLGRSNVWKGGERSKRISYFPHKIPRCTLGFPD